MTEVVKLKSGSVYEESHHYSRVVCVGDWILVSNTAGRNYTTREMPGDAVGQAQQALENVRGALEAVGADIADVVRVRLSVPDRQDAMPVMGVFADVFKGIDPAMTITCSPLAGDYKVEIETTAVRGVGAGEQDRRAVTLA